MTTPFNPDDFMNVQTEEVLETEYTPIPEDEYLAVIKKVEADTYGEKNSPALAITWLIDDEGVKALTGMDEPTCRQTIWLDIDENTGFLAIGKNRNVKLGKLRAALGQNDGRPWSPAMLEGQVARVQIKHRMSNDGAPQANVVAVTSA